MFKFKQGFWSFTFINKWVDVPKTMQHKTYFKLQKCFTKPEELDFQKTALTQNLACFFSTALNKRLHITDAYI